MDTKELRKTAQAVYLATDENVAKDIAAKLLGAASRIDKLEEQLSNSYEMTQLIHWAFNNHVQVAQYGTWFGTYTGEERPSGSNGCISYEQTFLTALRQAKANLGT